MAKSQLIRFGLATRGGKDPFHAGTVPQQPDRLTLDWCGTGGSGGGGGVSPEMDLSSFSSPVAKVRSKLNLHMAESQRDDA